MADHTAAGKAIADCYCPECGYYSGGGLCRVCQRGCGEFTAPTPDDPYVAGFAILCTMMGQGCDVVVATPARADLSATAAAGTPGPDVTTQESLL